VSPAKKMFSVRLPLPLIERLDQARWQLRLNKTTITRRALEEFLDRLSDPKEASDAGT
jgi:predicted DNA-binding protein